MEERTVPVLRAEGEDTFNANADRPVSEKPPASKIRHTHFHSLNRLKDTVGSQVASISTVVEDTAAWLLDDAERATSSGLDTKVLPVIRTNSNQSVDKDFQSSAIQRAVKRAIQ